MVRESKETQGAGWIVEGGKASAIIWLCQESGTTLGGGSPSRTVEHHDDQANMSRGPIPAKGIRTLSLTRLKRGGR